MIKILSNEVKFSNDVFFRYALSANDETSIFIRHSIIEALTGIHPKESTVLNPILDSSILGKKGAILDVHVRDVEGNEYNIEMQTTFSGASDLKRFELYGARMLSNQLGKGENYAELKPVYQIIFINAYTNNNKNLIDEYQMINREGQLEGDNSLIKRIYIHLPAIDKIAEEKGILHMSGFEQLCYLFKNNRKHDILKSEERLVRAIMEKYQNMQDDEDLWSVAMAIEMGEMRTENHIRETWDAALAQGKADGIKEGMLLGEKKGIAQGLQKGYLDLVELVIKLVKLKFGVDETKWLSIKTQAELEKISESLLVCQTIEELKDNMK